MRKLYEEPDFEIIAIEDVITDLVVGVSNGSDTDF